MKKVWNNVLAFTTVSRGFTWLVLFPTFVVALYYALIASPIYVSETHFTVRSQSGGTMGSTLFGGLLGGVSDTVATQDIAIVSDYIQSRDVLEELDRQLNLRAHFADSGIDWWAQMDDDGTAEEFLDYYRGKIEVLMNETTGIISLGIVCVLILGEIDLSVGSMSGLASALLGAVAASVQAGRMGNLPVSATDLRRSIARLHAANLTFASADVVEAAGGVRRVS